jgi:hypothetical protein
MENPLRNFSIGKKRRKDGISLDGVTEFIPRLNQAIEYE